jgi:hypothetical protein
VRIGSGEAGKLVPGFEGDADTGSAAEVDEPFEAVVPAVASHADMVELPGTGADGLLDWVEAVENFHTSSLLSKWKNSREALECLGAVTIALRIGQTFIFYGSFHQRASLLRGKERL